MNIVNKEEFKKRTNTNYPYNTFAEVYETNQKFECGCGEDHLIGEDGVKVNKQVDDFEFVVSCANTNRDKLSVEFGFYWSGRRDSNPRLQPWQGCRVLKSFAFS